jgi:hypothetical protein
MPICEHKLCQRDANLYMWRGDLKIPTCFKHAQKLEAWGFVILTDRELLPQRAPETK